MAGVPKSCIERRGYKCDWNGNEAAATTKTDHDIIAQLRGFTLVVVIGFGTEKQIRLMRAS